MPHNSKNLQLEDIQAANYIFCMSSEQKKKIIEKFPTSEEKVECLSKEETIDNPAGGSVADYLVCVTRLQVLLKVRDYKLSIKFH